MESLLVPARTVKAAAVNKKTPRYARKANASGKMPDVSDIIHCGYVAFFFFFQIATRDVNHREMSIRVPDNLDGDVLSRFVIQRSDHLTKASLANHLQDLVSECIHKFRIIYTCASNRHWTTWM